MWFSLRINAAAALVAASVLLAGCVETAETVNRHPYELGAPLVGATAGLAGASAIGGAGANIGLGATGAILGIAAIPYLKQRDVVYFDKAIDEVAVAKPGLPIRWQNPHTGTTGVMTRLKDVEVSVFLQCRKLRSEVTADKVTSTEQLVVCSDDGGPWFIRSSQTLISRPAG